MALQGKIVKGIAGFYYVDTGSRVKPHAAGVYACKAKGLFREQNIKPLPGDNVMFEITDDKDMEGNITSVLERKNALIRPEVANVDQALVVFAIREPDPNFLLLDRFLVMMQRYEIPVVVCFNKQDIAETQEEERLRKTYRACGCDVHVISALEENGLEALLPLLAGKTSVLAGPSGVGKSTLINYLTPSAGMEVGDLSKKIARGKNTTRHTELFRVERSLPLEEDAYIIDTPGFTALALKDIAAKELHAYYPEFSPFEEDCRFAGCVHINEPACAVKDAVKDGRIEKKRYETYRLLHDELAGTRPVYVKKVKK
ncbi:MAG: ribosome small subunit-dependent GTPase A [Lachnospiraceae bacterium]|nr:ribosome small subunit-dependent GTPase A [Lachnospiraceae bacterium]